MIQQKKMIGIKIIIIINYQQLQHQGRSAIMYIMLPPDTLTKVLNYTLPSVSLTLLTFLSVELELTT